MLNILKFILELRKNFLRFINKYIISRFSKNGKSYNVAEEERRTIPKYKNLQKWIIVGFYCFLVLLLILLLASFIKSSKAKKESHEAMSKSDLIERKYEDNASTVQYSPKLKLYADDFVDTYMSVPRDSKDLEERNKNLAKFFPSDYKVPDEKTSDSDRKLNSKEFYNIKRKDKQTIIQYIVNYDVNITEKKEVKVKKKAEKGKKQEYETKTEEKNRKVIQNVLINIPVKSENNKYVVVEYPYFTPIPDSHLTKEKMVEDNLKDNKREDNPKVKSFIEEFFNKYASSKSDDMAYLMNNPEGLEGTREVSNIKEVRLYPKGEKYIAKVEVLMKDKDSPLENLEHYTLEITEKDGKYYVERMTNSIGG